MGVVNSVTVLSAATVSYVVKRGVMVNSVDISGGSNLYSSIPTMRLSGRRLVTEKEISLTFWRVSISNVYILNMAKEGAVILLVYG